ncbi:MAG: hypothetical protein ACI9Y7_002849, partial [Dokdonia sp.]
DSMKTKAIKSIERKMKKLGITNSELSIT